MKQKYLIALILMHCLQLHGDDVATHLAILDISLNDLNKTLQPSQLQQQLASALQKFVPLVGSGPSAGMKPIIAAVQQIASEDQKVLEAILKQVGINITKPAL